MRRLYFTLVIGVMFCFILLYGHASESNELYNLHPLESGLFEHMIDLSPYFNTLYQRSYSPAEVQINQTSSSLIYEVTSWHSDIYTDRSGSWTLSCQIDLQSHNVYRDLFTANVSIYTPTPLEDFVNNPQIDCLRFNLADIYGGSFQLDSEFSIRSSIEYFYNNSIVTIPQNGTEIKVSNAAYVRVTRDANTNYFFAEYSQDGLEWRYQQSIYLDMDEAARYALGIYTSPTNYFPTHVFYKNVKLEPASPYAIRALSRDHYKWGSSVYVLINVENPRDQAIPVVVTEKIPEQWEISNIGHNGIIKHDAIEWNLTAPPGKTILSYLISPTRPTPREVIAAEFSGKIGDRYTEGISRLIPGVFNLETTRNMTFIGALFLGITLSMMLLHLCLFVFYPKQKENLYYGVFLMCVSSLIGLLTWIDFYCIGDRITNMDAMKLLYFFLLIALQSSLLLFFYTMFYKQIPKLYWFFLGIWGILILWFLVFSLSTTGPSQPLTFSTYPYVVFGVMTVIFCLESMRVLLLSLIKKQGGFIFIYGALFFIVALLYYVIYSFAPLLRYPDSFYWMFMGDWKSFLGFMVFVICMSIYIAYRTAQSHRELKSLNIELEDRVEKRTVELNTMNAELQEANAQLIQLDQMKSQFVSQASHDLRTPLTAIKGSLDNLLMGIAGDLNEKQQKVMTRATKSVDRLTNLINDVLDLNRIETGRIVLEKTDVPFKALVDNIIQENKPAADQKQIQLAFFASEGDYTLHIDGGKIERIVGELISNAIKYTPDQGTVSVNLGIGDEHVSLSIQDSGIGMTPEECEKIWERFYRTGASKKFAKGSGLGLSIAKELVELHGGALSVESEVEKGALFTLSLPRKGD